MSASLSDLVNNLSEINNKKECKTSMKRKNIRSECDFIGIKDKKLRYKCKICNEKWSKPVNELKVSSYISILHWRLTYG